MMIDAMRNKSNINRKKYEIIIKNPKNQKKNKKTQQNISQKIQPNKIFLKSTIFMNHFFQLFRLTNAKYF